VPHDDYGAASTALKQLNPVRPKRRPHGFWVSRRLSLVTFFGASQRK
jgi:hypothetical protein